MGQEVEFFECYNRQLNYRVGVNEVTNIFYYTPMGAMEKHRCEVIMEDGTVSMIFDIDSVVFVNK